MKKHIIYLLALIMVLSPMAAFAQDGEAAPSGDAVAAEEQLAEIGDENAVATENVVNDSEESVVEEIPEAAAEEDTVASEEPQNAAENNDGQTTVKANSYNMKYNTETAGGTTEEWQPRDDYDGQWNRYRTMYRNADTLEIYKGLFLGSRKADGGRSLYYADSDGLVVQNEQLVTVPSGEKRYIHESIEDGRWREADNNLAYSYLLVNHNGDFYVQYREGVQSTAGNNYYVTENGTVRTTAGIQATGADKYYIQDGGVIRTAEGFVTDTDGKKYYVRANTNGMIRTDAGVFSYNGKKYYTNAGGDLRIKEGIFKTADGQSKYYMTASGIIKTKKGFKTYNGKRYYVKDGGEIPLKAAIIKVGKSKYYRSKSGVIRTKVGKFRHPDQRLFFVKNTKGVLAANKAFKYKGKLYHAKKSTVLATGVHKWKDNNFYYGNPDSAVIKTSRGIVTKDVRRFFVQKGGKIATNTKISYNGRGYIAGKNGAFKTGLFKWRGTTYYAEKDGTLKTRAGYVTVNGVRYFVFAGGKVAINAMYTYNGSTYITDSKGQPRKGLINYNGNTYYAYSDGEIETSRGIRRINGRNYFIYSGGRIAKGGFVSDGGVYYYAESSGVIRTYSFTYNGVKVTPNSSTGEISKEDYNKAINGITEDSTDSNTNSSNA